MKPPADPVDSRLAARLQALTWVLIYGVLLTGVLGLFVKNANEATGWSMVVGGAVAAGIGCALIYLRFRLKD